MNVKYHMEDMVSIKRDRYIFEQTQRIIKETTTRQICSFYLFRGEYPVPKDIIFGRVSVIPPSHWW